jgi:hypothetical protein
VGDKIIRRRGLPPWLDGFAIAHELGHRVLVLTRRGVEGMDVESWSNAFAGALLVPDAALRAAWQIGHDLQDLIERYPNVAPTCLALRVGEARLADAVVVQGAAVRYVRSETAPTRELVELGREAARVGRVVRPGVAKAWRLADVARRAAVVVELAEMA